MRLILPLLGLLLLVTTGTFAQTSLNPDISAIGDFRAYMHNDEIRPKEKDEFRLSDPEFELSINGYLNPFVRGDVVIAWHGDHNAEIEEVYATVLRGLPLGTNLRVGKYLLEFGRLNPVHPHAYSFIKRPLPHEVLLGEEGLNDMAVRSSFLLPTGEAYTEFMAAVLKGGALLGHHHEDEGETTEVETDETEPDELGFFGRLASSFAVADHAELALGGSAANSPYALEEGKVLRAWLLGGDIKYKYKPSRYTTLQIEAEGIARQNETHDGDKLNSYGSYGYVDYRFNQRYNVGGIFEWVREKEAHHHDEEEAEAEEGEEHEIHSSELMRFGLFCGFAPVEETSLLRLAGHWTEPDEGDGFFELTMQLIISLGPHQPHNF